MRKTKFANLPPQNFLSEIRHSGAVIATHLASIGYTDGAVSVASSPCESISFAVRNLNFCTAKVLVLGHESGAFAVQKYHYRNAGVMERDARSAFFALQGYSLPLIFFYFADFRGDFSDQQFTRFASQLTFCQCQHWAMISEQVVQPRCRYLILEEKKNALSKSLKNHDDI